MITVGIRVLGVEKAIGALNAKVSRKIKLSRQGLIKAGLTIQRKAQEIVPVDLGNLRSSAFTVWTGMREAVEVPKFESDPEGKRKVDVGRLATDHDRITSEYSARAESVMSDRVMKVFVGFSAYYAIFVHENVAKHQSGKTWKFLELAVYDTQKEIVEAYARGASA